MQADPLSDVLALVKAQSVVTGGLHAGGAWALRFPPPRQIKFYALAKGSCWLTRGQDPTVRLEAGDVVLISARQPLLLASDLAAEPADATEVFAHRRNGFAIVGDGADVTLLGGVVSLDPRRGHLLHDVLPPMIRLHGTQPEAVAVQLLLKQLAGEVNAGRAGARLASTLLTQLMFLNLLRAEIAADGPLVGGWLKALADARLAPALHLMHADPGRSWQLADLAKSAAMSRTAFALRFKAKAGIAPLTYLTHWRMRLAERALREEDAPLSAIALSLGYTSESAFSNAFKRVIGMAPNRYRIAARRGNDGPPVDEAVSL